MPSRISIADSLRAFACLAALACCLPAPIAAHPTGVSKVDIFMTVDSVKATVDVNRADLTYALNLPLIADAPAAEFESMSDRIAHYFETRLNLKFDGRSAPVKVLRWRKHGDPALKLDSAALADTTVVLHMGWAVPAGAARLEMGSQLFAELQVQPLCHLRVYFKEQEVRRKFLSLDNRIGVPLAADSLEALHAAAVLPPGTPGAANLDDEPVIAKFLWQGFLHILPEGLDHILFVLGLFFFSTLLRPLLIQVTAFTIAHSITLGLAMFGLFSMPARIVEPLIALSIVVVAAENIFFRKLRPSRFVIVFAFGLIHGLGFAGVLQGLGLPEGQFLKVLISFNVGVEGGQLAVVALAAAATFWMWKKPWYHKRVVIPVSTAIAAVGLFWFIERLVQGPG